MPRLLLVLLLALASLQTSLLAQPAPPLVSPERLPDGSVVFRLQANNAREVVLKGQWPGAGQGLPLVADEKQIWSVALPAVPAGVWEYHYLVDGLRVIDPRNPAIKPQRAPSSSVLHIPATPPAPWDWQPAIPHGALHRHEYASVDPARPRSLVVYTPPGYESAPEQSYPLLVLQHGSGDNERAWTEHGKAHWILDHLLQAGAARPMVVLMIDGHPAPNTGDRLAAFRRELFEDALPLVEKTYRVLPGAENRALVGLSMGGGQALNVGLASLDRFAWIGAFSAAVPNPERRVELLAEPDALNSRLRLLWIACGEGDFLIKPNTEFVADLQARGIRHEWRLTPGDHSWPVWRDYLAELLPKLFR